jgi:NAD kinase
MRQRQRVTGRARHAAAAAIKHEVSAVLAVARLSSALLKGFRLPQCVQEVEINQDDDRWKGDRKHKERVAAISIGAGGELVVDQKHIHADGENRDERVVGVNEGEVVFVREIDFFHTSDNLQEKIDSDRIIKTAAKTLAHKERKKPRMNYLVSFSGIYIEFALKELISRDIGNGLKR